MSQIMNAPASVTPGSTLYYPDGTTATVRADGTVVCPEPFEADLVNLGWTYGPTTTSTTSQVSSKSDSGLLAASSALSTVAGIQANESFAASKGDSAGTQASNADSKGVSVSVATSTLTSRRTSSNK